jgi:putative heme-binding domain-containing protein
MTYARHAALALVWLIIIPPASIAGQTDRPLEDLLWQEGPAVLADDALRSGDPARGAAVFYQSTLGCIKCHRPGDPSASIGPDLAAWRQGTTVESLVESLLQPSRAVREGYESVTLELKDGRVLTGILDSENEKEVVVRDPSVAGQKQSIDPASIMVRTRNSLSLMPSGQVNVLAGRDDFLHLVRFLWEIARQGPGGVRRLAGPLASIHGDRLPEYEGHVDHAGLIRGWDGESLARGEAVYKRVCVNCHGTVEGPGSLPTSLRFASGEFKNGSDPHSMYRTLTYGFGQMTPQTWMVPRQKYDVIHYIRETFLRPHNPSQLTGVSPAYLAALPPGDTLGPEGVLLEPWLTADYGPFLIGTYETGADGENFAHKGIAVRLDPGPGGVARGRYWMIFDHDTLRMSACYSGQGFIDWNGIHFNGQHGRHPRVTGRVDLAIPTGPGWANPHDGSHEDPRFLGRDGRRYGPLPRDWGKFRGLYSFGDRVVLSYTIGSTSVLEMPGVIVAEERALYTRTFEMGPREKDLVLVVCGLSERGARIVTEHSAQGVVARVTTGAASSRDEERNEPVVVAGVSPDVGAHFSFEPGSRLELLLPAGNDPLRFVLWAAPTDDADAERALRSAAPRSPTVDLAPLLSGGPKQWPERLTTVPAVGPDDGPFASDDLVLPANNPWLAQVRPSGIDFLPDPDAAAVCTWDGDVWIVSGLSKPGGPLSWQRIASGLFQPLGLKVVDGTLYVTCRDQIVRLCDLNGDGHTDYYECFNNDHQVTEHFHEFAMGLQTDAEGNFYYAKSARHALPALVAHHGTLLRVSRDGSRTDILATGFRAANGVCLNPDGTFIVTDQEGHWNPKNRINWVQPGGFYGNMFGYHDVTDPSDQAMQKPLCWITNSFDRSPAELLWVPKGTWGPLSGSLINLSYGYGKIFVVPHEHVAGQVQGGMCQLPLPQFPTGIMRGRFHPAEGHLYACGLFSWAGDQTQAGGLYRVRATGKKMHLPIGLVARPRGLEITFTDPLDPAAASDVARYAVRVWSLERSANYGSKHVDEHPLSVERARLSADGRTVLLSIPEIGPTWCMSIEYTLLSETGEPVRGAIHNTIHNLSD